MEKSTKWRLPLLMLNWKLLFFLQVPHFSTIFLMFPFFFDDPVFDVPVFPQLMDVISKLSDFNIFSYFFRKRKEKRGAIRGPVTNVQKILFVSRKKNATWSTLTSRKPSSKQESEPKLNFAEMQIITADTASIALLRTLMWKFFANIVVF